MPSVSRTRSAPSQPTDVATWTVRTALRQRGVNLIRPRMVEKDPAVMRRLRYVGVRRRDHDAARPGGHSGGMKSLQDRVAVVTGSSRGIGAAIAELFAREGARVVVHGRDAGAVERVRAGIAAAGGAALAVTADLTDFAQIEDVRARVEAGFGPVDVLVANAGGSPV